jgi:hypothetical protein
MLDWFQTEVQEMPTAFAEGNQNITYFALAGVLRILMGVQYRHLPELRRLLTSSDASLLQSVPDEIGKIARKLVCNWWTNHGLPITVNNQVSFVPIYFVVWR